MRLNLLPNGVARLPPLLLVVALALVSGCGGQATPTPDTGAILNSTAQRLDAVKTVHFTMQIEGEAYIDSSRQVLLRAANGDIVTPDQMQTKLTIGTFGVNLDISLVALGADRYMTDPITGRWGPAQPGFDYTPTILFDKERGLSKVLLQMRDVQRLANEKVNNEESYHLKGMVARAAIDPLTSGAIEGDPVGAELWIAPGNFNLVKLVLTEPPGQNKAKPAVWTLTFEKYDQPVTINRPQ